jgi:hypothetical protein
MKPHVRLRRQGSVIIAGVLLLLRTTAAPPGPDASRTELMAYSAGSALALITGISVVIKLRVLLLKAAGLLAAVTLLYLLCQTIVRAVIG